MKNRIFLDMIGAKEIALEVEEASVFVFEEYGQCWCLSLKLYWQTLLISGWAHLSPRYGELVFMIRFDNDIDPPHYISGAPIKVDSDNDGLYMLADIIGVNARDLAKSIFAIIGEIKFIMPPVRQVTGDVIIDSAMAYHYRDQNYKLRIASWG